MSGLIPYFRAEPIPVPLPEHLDLLGYRFSFPQDWTIQPFGLLVATGLMVGTWVAERRGRKVGVHSNAVSSCIAHILITAFIVAHMFDALAYHPEVVMARPLFLLRRSGIDSLTDPPKGLAQLTKTGRRHGWHPPAEKTPEVAICQGCVARQAIASTARCQTTRRRRAP